MIVFIRPAFFIAASGAWLTSQLLSWWLRCLHCRHRRLAFQPLSFSAFQLARSTRRHYCLLPIAFFSFFTLHSSLFIISLPPPAASGFFPLNSAMGLAILYFVFRA
ncbi:MAG: hypothetical protein IKR48_07240 [Kiritimatiellae bacterium]|nr:hypothetical protein [Kiritimatiellia bacterium]